MANETPKCAYFFGDSITNGASSQEGGWPEVIRSGLVIDGEFDHFKAYQLGVDGDTTGLIADRARREVSARLAAFRDNYFILAAGLNDTLSDVGSGEPVTDRDEFAGNLKRILSIFEEFHPAGILLVGITPISPDRVQVDSDDGSGLVGEYNLRTIGEYNEDIRRLSEERSLPFVDLYGAGLASPEFLGSLQASDGIHPTSAGQYWIAGQVRPDFDIMVAQAGSTQV